MQNLDLTAGNRRLIHEGPLTWRIQYSKKTVGEYGVYAYNCSVATEYTVAITLLLQWSI